MTLGQARGFMAAIERQRRADAFAQALGARMAQAEGKAWRKYVDSLRHPHG